MEDPFFINAANIGIQCGGSHEREHEAVDALAAAVAHRFNNLLTVIVGNASLVLDSVPAQSPAEVMVREILGASERAAEITRLMLVYLGQGSFMVEQLSLSELIARNVSSIRAALASNVELRFDLAQQLPPIAADRAQVLELLVNLVLNGAEAIGDLLGVVSVRTDVWNVDQHCVFPGPEDREMHSCQYVFLEVRDTGCGMDEATKARIFDPFFSTKFIGRGLGLTAALGIVRGYGGAITVKSSPGAGSMFTVLFPASPNESQVSRSTCLVPRTQLVSSVENSRR